MIANRCPTNGLSTLPVWKMDPSAADNTQVQALLDQAACGDDDAYGELLARASERLLKLTRKMLKNYPHLRRWEQTDDVFQSAAIRLHQSLSKVRPETVRQFFGFAATQIRRTLIDLARHHFGPEGHAAKHQTDGGKYGDMLQAQPDPNAEPGSLEGWAAFHAAVDGMPDEEKQVFDLVWYGGTTQREAAEILQISERTVIRRLHKARRQIKKSLHGEQPPLDR
jgi:RNA polymerase sigma-70 factor (ECF subfamily)